MEIEREVERRVRRRSLGEPLQYILGQCFDLPLLFNDLIYLFIHYPSGV